MDKEKYRLVAGRDEVDGRIGEMAEKIISDFPESSPLFVALLRGAAPFAGKLMTEIARRDPDYHPEVDYMMVSTYGSGRQSGEPRIVTDLAPATKVTGREAIIIDDVLDKGVTANFVEKHLRNMGAHGVRLAVLAQKNVERDFPVTPDYCGFDAGDKWLVGMGMDDARAALEGYRWIDEIWEVKRD